MEVTEVTQTTGTAPETPVADPIAPQAPENAVVEQPTLESLTNGRFRSPEDVDSFYNEYEQLKATPKVEFANDFLKQLNDGFQSGTFKGVTDALKFMQLQTLDVQSLTPEQAIKAEKALQKPDWDEKKVNEWFDVNFPEIDQEDLDATVKQKRREFELDDKAQDARTALLSKKVDPETLKAREQGPTVDKQADFEKKVQSVLPVTTKVVGEFREHTISFKDEKAGIDYQLTVPSKLTAEEKTAISSAVAMEVASRGIDTNSAQGAKTVDMAVRNVIMSKENELIREAIIRDAFASAKEIAIRELSNARPPQSGSGSPRAKPQENRNRVSHGGGTYV